MCNKLDAPLEHGRFLTPDGIYEDEIATYQCDANYVLIGSDSATCMADRTWVTEQPHCKSRKYSGMCLLSYIIFLFVFQAKF